MEIDKATRLSVQNVLKEGLTDIFTAPTELRLLRNKLFQKKVIENVTKCIKGNSLESLEIAQIDHVLLPKGGPFDFRRCALIHPLDTIKFLALSLTFADQLESLRPKKITKVVFSYRFKSQNGYIFDTKYNITSFKKHVSQKVRQKSTKVLVTCDIANFYDRLNIHRLESILLSNGFEKTRVKQLNELLLFWANRDSYSLPVGSNASRILAEAALLEVDNYLLSIGVQFCRFVDDYRLFAPNAHTAHYWLTQLIERLWLEGLTINQRKTKIEDVSSLKPISGEEAKETSAPPENKKKEKTSSEEPEPQFRLMAGYGGTIPTRFRAPNLAELSKLKESDPRELFNSIKEKKITEPDDIKSFIKSVLGSEKYIYFSLLPELADLFPQFTPYIVDVLIKYKDKIESSEKKKIQEVFSRKIITSEYLPEYLTIAIVQLLGCEDYQDKKTLLDLFRGLKRNAGAYIGRVILDSIEVVRLGSGLQVDKSTG
ncbi:MAG: RNA-directed DNA polymerase [Thermodesulfobacteriota bacterium]